MQVSLGHAVPEMAFQRSRGESELVPFYADMGPDGVERYWKRKNVRSIDGKPTGILVEAG